MAQRVIDLSLTIEDNMPAHKLFQRPVITTHMSHESTKALNLGVSGDPMTFQTNFIATLDHVGTHVDAFRHVNAKGQPVDEMPLDLFMGKALCFDLRHIPDTTEAPPRRCRRRGRISGRPWRPKLTDSTAPMAPECQSFLDNVVAQGHLIAELPRWITRERPVR